MTNLKVLILGGYGTFGGRLAQLLADETALNLIIAGRSHAQATAFCKRLAAQARLVPVVFDRDGDLSAQLTRVGPDLIVDASGPFQNYDTGGDPYRVVRAALALGINYLDLADGSDFVKGITQFDAEARARGVFVLSGVSSFPVLTAAVVRQLVRGPEKWEPVFGQDHAQIKGQGLARVDTIAGGIAPSPYAGVGLNVIRAIAGYAGQPVALIRDGKPATGHAIIDARRVTIAPPGRLPLDNVRFSLVDVPDLKVLPELWPGLREIWMGAGPVPGILHRALSAIAWLVRLKLVPSLAPLGPLMYRAINVLRWGEHRGGMFVTIEGERHDGARVTRSWHLLAEGDDGPLIPSMAAEAIIRHVLAGRSPVAGARAATNDLELTDYDTLFARRQIVTGMRQEDPEQAREPLYRRLLGDAWSTLPVPIRHMHELSDTLTAEGVANVERGRGIFARLVAAIVGFPNAGQEVPVTVQFRTSGGVERWQRTFAGRSFASTQEAGRGRFEHLLCEWFGPVAIGLALVVDRDRLRLVVRRWSCLGIPLPRALAPVGDAYEHVDNGRFCFHVEIGHRLTGMIVRYRGWLLPRGSGEGGSAPRSISVPDALVPAGPAA
jgi:uncharacterized protein DUF4166/saccharopine dehydrogenase-like protein